jgi:deoxyribose-phosphate aldolase
MSSTTDALIDAITREVLAALTADSGCGCGDPSCRGACAARCSDAVRGVVSNGAERISYSGEGAEVPRDLARYIDHTLLRPDATAADIDKLCEEARSYGFAAVCVNPTWVQRCARNLRGSGVRVASVIGFPFGAGTTEVKAAEARRAIRDGAREIDMVINVGALKSGDYELVRRDIEKVADACREAGALSKVIIEAAYLTDEEKVVSSHLAKAAKADFVKTSTGFGPGGATVHDVLLMRETVGPKLGVKAAGGIRSAEDAREMIAAGATRIGASASVQIVTGEETSSGQRY